MRRRYRNICVYNLGTLCYARISAIAGRALPYGAVPPLLLGGPFGDFEHFFIGYVKSKKKAITFLKTQCR